MDVQVQDSLLRGFTRRSDQVHPGRLHSVPYCCGGAQDGTRQVGSQLNVQCEEVLDVRTGHYERVPAGSWVQGQECDRMRVFIDDVRCSDASDDIAEYAAVIAPHSAKSITAGRDAQTPSLRLARCPREALD
jgi:hypothetical protein